MKVTAKVVGRSHILARVGCWTAALGLLAYLCGYALDVNKRMTRAPGCQWNVAPNPDAMPYLARYCYLSKDTVLLRLYGANGEQLLAERMFFELDFVRLYWRSDTLNYDTETGGSIPLPPTTLDRFRAKLP